MASPALSTVLQYEPTARFGHCTAVVNGRLLMYGGTDSDEPPSVVEIFEDRTWKSMLTTGELPEGYAGLTATAVADTLFTFAGMGREGLSNKLFALRTVSLEWNKLHPVNPDEAPSAKLFSAIIAFGRNMLCSFGGKGPLPTSPYPGAEYVAEEREDDGNGWNNELACYDLSKGVLCITLFTLLCNSVHT